MAQIGWVYLDDFGGQHRIGLYHGDRSGHVLLHCDLRVVQIDFSVKESRMYSFFVEDELCEVYIVQEKNGFSYDFQVNKKIDTPRNQLRRADERRNRKYMAILLGGIALVVGAIFVGLRWYGHSQEKKLALVNSLYSPVLPEHQARLLEEGKTATAQLLIVEEDLRRRVYYGFLTADNTRISGIFTVPDTGLILLPNGFPLSDRDAFSVRYVPAEPKIHRVDFSEPADQTLAGYLQQAFDAERRAHPAVSEAHSLCVATVVMKRKGWPQLADVIFQTTDPHANGKHNRESYLRLIREPELAQAVTKECWDK